MCVSPRYQIQDRGLRKEKVGSSNQEDVRATFASVTAFAAVMGHFVYHIKCHEHQTKRRQIVQETAVTIKFFQPKEL